MKKVLWTAAIFAMGWALPGGALAGPYYEGKTITVIVGYGPGGGYDRVARLVAKHLPKYIPGNPTVIVENMPGADSMIAANNLFNKAAPDGLTLGTFNRGLTFAQLLKAPGARFDLREFAWIGSAASEGTVLALRSDLPYKSLDDVRKANTTLILGYTGAADSSGQFPVLLGEALGLGVKMITYPSSSDVMLAIERKEVDGRGASYTSILPFIERGLVRPVVRGRVGEQGMEGLPVDQDIVSDPKWKRVMALRSAPDVIGRPFVCPPKTPESVMTILRQAFAAVANDPELKAESKKMRLPINYISAPETMKVLNEILNERPDVVQEISRFVKF